MLRVFHIVSRFDLGGAEQVALAISRHGSDDIEYHIVEVVRARAPYTRHFINDLKQAGVRSHRALVPLIRFHYVFERLAAMLFPIRMLILWLCYRPSAVHLHTEVPDMAYVCFARVFPFIARKINAVRTVHNTVLWTGLPRTAQRVEKFMKENARQAAVSQAVADAYYERFGTRINIIYNGVSSVRQKKYDGLVEGKINILFAGRMEQQKGIKVLVEIIKSLKDEDRYFFHVFGDGSLRQFAERELNNLPNVRLGKPLFNLPEVIGSFDFLLMPSEFEGLGLLSVEASLGGSLPIVNNCLGLNETIPADWPLLVEGNSIEQYQQIFRNKLPLIDREKLKSNIHKFASERFNMTSMVDKYEALYKRNSC